MAGVDNYLRLKYLIENQEIVEVVDHEIQNETTGFGDPTIPSYSYNSEQRTLTLSGSWAAYNNGHVVFYSSGSWTSSPHDAGVTGSLYLSWENGHFTWSDTPWEFFHIPIAYLYFDASGNYKFTLRECHGLMPWTVHKYLHETSGTYRLSGGVLSEYAVNSVTPADRRPDTSSSVVVDEDIQTTNPAHVSTEKYTIAYLTDDGVLTFSEDNDDLVLLDGTKPYWNELNGTWGQSAMGNNSFMNMWQFATPAAEETQSQKYRYFWLQGQVNGNRAVAQAETIESLTLGNLTTIFTEIVPINKVTVRYVAGAINNWGIDSVTQLTGTRSSLSSISQQNAVVESTEYILVAEGVNASTGTKYTTQATFDYTILSVVGYATVAPQTTNMLIDIEKNGTTIFTDQLTIDAGDNSSLDSSTLPTFSDASVSTGDVLEFDIDQIGTTPGEGQGVKVIMKIVRS